LDGDPGDRRLGALAGSDADLKFLQFEIADAAAARAVIGQAGICEGLDSEARDVRERRARRDGVGSVDRWHSTAAGQQRIVGLLSQRGAVCRRKSQRLKNCPVGSYITAVRKGVGESAAIVGCDRKAEASELIIGKVRQGRALMKSEDQQGALREPDISFSLTYHTLR